MTAPSFTPSSSSRSPASSSGPRAVAALTVDLEDYRRQELSRLRGGSFPPHPDEVERQLHLLLDAFEACDARATFFSVGRLSEELRPSLWSDLARRHKVGCHGHEHLHAERLGSDGFYRDLCTAKAALEDALGEPVISFRSPYFSGEHCDPWYGERLAQAGFQLDSSRRLGRCPEGFCGSLELVGSGGLVREVPLPSIGVGAKRLTIIGGTYFRLLPLALIKRLLRYAAAQRFVPLVYLHPYDIDPDAEALELPWGRWRERAGDRIRRAQRSGVAAKLHALAETYDFQPLETIFSRES